MQIHHIRAKLDVVDADLSGSKFDDVNMAGWTMHNVNLTGLQVTDANMTGAAIADAQITGMTINGILVTDLLAAYHASRVPAPSSTPITVLSGPAGPRASSTC
jgi:uncharacterized protein YjbI with pentapeptide repeats